MKYPLKAILTKIGTRNDDTRPNYSIGTSREGRIWEFNYPMIGKPFRLHTNKLYPSFITSNVVDITYMNEERTLIQLLTENSIYRLELSEINT